MMTDHLSLFSPSHRGGAPHGTGGHGKAVAGAFAIGVVMAAGLWGTGASFNDLRRDIQVSDASTTQTDSLDLSKPLFVKGELCPYEGLLASFSEANSQGCLVADDRKPVMVVATATNGLQAQVFKVDMETAEGTVEGWVASDSLRN